MNELEDHFEGRIARLLLALEIAREEIIGYKHLMGVVDPECRFIDTIIEQDAVYALAKPQNYVIN